MDKFFTIFRIPELRNKILFTLGLLGIYRLGLYMPLPIVDQVRLRAWGDTVFGVSEQWGALASHLSMFSGTDLHSSTIFGLGIMPYISASIIFQLLASVVPALEKLQKEGEVGRKKINEYTRYAAVLISFLQSVIWLRILLTQTVNDATGSYPVVNPAYTETFWSTFFYGSVTVMTMTAGTIFLMWVGEQIDEFGIGNGISLIIMCGIIGRLPSALFSLGNSFDWQFLPESGLGIEDLVVLGIMFVGVVVAVVYMTQGQRRIPTQSAKHQRGRRVFGGNRQYLPLRVNQAGVMPIIFASSLLMLPAVPLMWLANAPWMPRWLQEAIASFTSHGFLYFVCEILLIYFFCYFWVAITFNPKDMANNLKDYGSFIPGYRPGKRTADYLEKVMMRLTYVGAAFIGLVAIVPTIVARQFQLDYAIAGFFGGTSLLIIVSVALDLVQKIDSHLIMRNYNSLLGTQTN